MNFGNYLSNSPLAGSKRNASDDLHAWLLKTDSSGNEQWNKTYGETYVSTVANSIQETSDKGYIVAGFSYSNAWLLKVSNSTVDIISPNTAIALEGIAGNNNWYVSDVIVNLTAQDNSGGSGINKTEYSFDNSTWSEYNGNFTVSSEGTTIVYYRSMDKAGNVEATRNTSISIDKTKPSITINVPFGEYFIGDQILANWQATELVSGLNSTSATVPNGTAIDTTTAGSKTFSVNATDNAGNEVNKTVEYNVIAYYNGPVYFINGTVIDSESEAGLAGIKVSANATLSTTTDATGFYSFAVTDGTYNMVSTYDFRYYTNITTVSTAGKAVVLQDIEMIKKPTGNITGNVTKI